MNIMDRSSVQTAHYSSRSHSLITHLQQGDLLSVIVPSGYRAYSYVYDLTFTGFLIWHDVTTDSLTSATITTDSPTSPTSHDRITFSDELPESGTANVI